MSANKKKGKSKYTRAVFKRELPLHLMLVPGLILIAVFSYTPMAGLVIAFQNFIPSKGMFGDQQWVGLQNFSYVFSLPGFEQALKNTIVIAFWKILLGLVVPIAFALLLNEIHRNGFKRTVQTIVYLPYFLSWVVLGGIFLDLLSPSTGIVNQLITALGGKNIFFLGDNRYFQPTLILTDVWKNFGYGAIVYLAAILTIDTDLYEAASIDGANRWKQTWHVTLPGMRMIIVLMLVLSLGNVLNAGFDQVFNLYSKAVYESGDILDTFVYRLGLIDAQYGPATAVGLFKSVISTVFISVSYFLAYKFADYRIF
ncbi:MAG: ABC transporter permease subunit [Eubacteriales bacterium]|nr:ABC transporter permease subunit [Eubacteriales bacterium]